MHPTPSKRDIENVDIESYRKEFDSPLDPGIAPMVKVLREAGIETYESCEGGPGHAYPEPTVRFYGPQHEGFRALAAAQAAGLKVYSLRRIYQIRDGEPVGPDWEMVFCPSDGGTPFWLKMRADGASVHAHGY